MVITRHGKRRIKERLGLPKRAHSRHIDVVIKQGILYSREKLKAFKVTYQGFLYVFVLDRNLKPILVTTYSVNN